jgi:hypothetical protein
MRRITFRTRLVALACTLMLFAGALAYALPGKEVEKIYYSGPDKEVEVGGSYLSCNGSFIKWGKITPWYERFEAPCD